MLNIKGRCSRPLSLKTKLMHIDNLPMSTSVELAFDFKKCFQFSVCQKIFLCREKLHRQFLDFSVVIANRQIFEDAKPMSLIQGRLYLIFMINIEQSMDQSLTTIIEIYSYSGCSSITSLVAPEAQSQIYYRNQLYTGLRLKHRCRPKLKFYFL